MTATPELLWLRRDLRLDDNPALAAALAHGGPVICFFLRDGAVDALGAAPRLRLGLGLVALAHALEGVGSRLILRSGEAGEALARLAGETGARRVHCARLYEPEAEARDAAARERLAQDGVALTAHAGHLLHAPGSLRTQAGGVYKVFSPFWRAARARDIAAPIPAPSRLPAPDRWPASEALKDWAMARAMVRGADVVARHARPGEAAAQARLERFIDERMTDYPEARDIPARPGTSELSEHQALGEISPRRAWHAALARMQQGNAGAEAFLRQLAWRDFAYHLLADFPALDRRNWRADWDGFPWSRDADSADVLAWKQGRTGSAFVDAAMREMFVTGRMHNRARMIAASYLTKHLLVDWRIGLRWFADCLIDWDPANNALGWQWVAGSGPDAAPFFRIFNPETQAKKFDPRGSYRARWLAEGQEAPGEDALAFYEAAPRSWRLSPGDAPPAPLVDLGEGRARALAAYNAHRG